MGNEEPSAVGQDEVQEHLRNVKVHKPMGPAEIHLWVLRKLSDEVTKSLSIIFGSCGSPVKSPLTGKWERKPTYFKMGNKEEPEN